MTDADAVTVQRRAAEATQAFQHRRHISHDETMRSNSFEDLSLSEGRVEMPAPVFANIAEEFIVD